MVSLKMQSMIHEEVKGKWAFGHRIVPLTDSFLLQINPSESLPLKSLENVSIILGTFPEILKWTRREVKYLGRRNFAYYIQTKQPLQHNDTTFLVVSF